MGKGGSQTIGYHYLFDILWGLSRGPLNELVEIEVGEKKAWTTGVTDDSIQAIRKPELFGGEKKEGGIQGPFRMFPGRYDQVLPGAASINCGSSGPNKGNRTLPNVKTSIGGLVSEFRGTTMLWYSGLISSMNPYPKEWKFRVRRYNAGWYNDEPWYPVMARIVMAGGAVQAMNPAHIIYECLTNPEWGRGLPASFLDENSFIYAANKLCDEGFGLCFRWQRKDDVDVFINNVLEHIAASYYLDPETGLIVLKLWRNDYIVDDLPVFTPSSGLLDITDDDSGSQDATFNEVIGKGYDPITNLEFQLRVHNLAARQSQGAPNPQTKEYNGIPTRDLLVRVLQRDLAAHASGLKRFTVYLDRRAWRLRPGMCFCIQDARRNIGNIVLRAIQIGDTDKKGRIEIKAMQDVYGLPATSFVTPTDPTWEPPPNEALPPTDSLLFEANYRDMRLRFNSADLADFDGSAVIGLVALSPNPIMYQYELATKAEGEAELEIRSTSSFTGAATLVDAIGPYDTEFEITGETDFTEDLVGQAVLLGQEQLGIVAYDDVTHMLTVKRGIADTIPTTHAAAETIWTIDDDTASDFREYIPGETMQAAALTRAPGDLLDLVDADVQSLEVVGRFNMPYPPGNVRVDGDPALDLPAAEYPEPVVTWSHRDRIIQEDQIVAHEEGDIGPEAGTSYNIRVLDKDDTTIELSSYPGVVSGWQYDSTLQATDGSPTAVIVELESERDGLTSFQRYQFRVQLTAGYGLGYGLNYGGA
jgi:hypothetical protein